VAVRIVRLYICLILLLSVEVMRLIFQLDRDTPRCSSTDQHLYKHNSRLPLLVPSRFHLNSNIVLLEGSELPGFYIPSCCVLQPRLAHPPCISSHPHIRLHTPTPASCSLPLYLTKLSSGFLGLWRPELLVPRRGASKSSFMDVVTHHHQAAYLFPDFLC
jgi:hypothetical protein